MTFPEQHPWFSDFFELIAEASNLHGPSTKFHAVVTQILKGCLLNTNFNQYEMWPENFGPFGNVTFPLTKMGAVSSFDILSSLDELIIFAFYWKNRNRYKRAADIGANIGLHSVLMSRLGWLVNSYEPDPTHITLFEQIILANRATGIKLFPMAVSDKSGTADFIRVLGNTTSSHLAGSKSAPFGDLDKFKVTITDFQTVLKGIDFVKIDAEGHEKTLIENTIPDNFENTDMLVEVGSKQNAQAIYSHLSSIGVNMFSQKSGWAPVRSFDGMPTHYKEGSLFVSQKQVMPWSI